MTIQELLQTLNKDAVNFISCIQSEYDNIGRYAENTIYFAQDTKALYKGSVLYCKLSEIGSLTNLDTLNKQSLVAAINEVNQKAINQGGNGTINDSTISPFAGFMIEAEMNQIVLEHTDSNDGAVYCDFYGNGFYYKVGNMFHAFWNYGYEYNSGISSGGYTKAKEGKIFSYNDKHYIVYNGTLQDLSVLADTGNIQSITLTPVANGAIGAHTMTISFNDGSPRITVSILSYTAVQAIINILNGTATDTTKGLVTLSDSVNATNDATKGIAATPKAVADLGVNARNYTNTQIGNKIKLVQQLPDSPIDGVLYLIPETSLSKPTEE